MESEHTADVLISGAGSIGLLVGVILSRMGVNVRIIGELVPHHFCLMSRL